MSSFNLNPCLIFYLSLSSILNSLSIRCKLNIHLRKYKQSLCGYDTQTSILTLLLGTHWCTSQFINNNQPQEEDHEEEAESVSQITTVPPYYIPPHMQNIEEFNFKDSEYSGSLDRGEVQHSVGTLFEGMYLLTKQEVQHALEKYHVSKEANDKT